jgi:hypothetical protein
MGSLLQQTEITGEVQTRMPSMAASPHLMVGAITRVKIQKCEYLGPLGKQLCSRRADVQIDHRECWSPGNGLID